MKIFFKRLTKLKKKKPVMFTKKIRKTKSLKLEIKIEHFYQSYKNRRL